MSIECILNELNKNKMISNVPSVYVVKITLEVMKILQKNNLIELEEQP